jgi:SPP1 gp7 family putative phage head morphogenesis protein
MVQGAAFTDAGAIATEINSAVQAALRNRLQPTGGLRGATQEIQAEVGLIFDRFLPAMTLEARPLIAPGSVYSPELKLKIARAAAEKIQDAAALERLRRAGKRTVSERTAQRAAAAKGRTLTNGHATALRTGWAKWYNDGVTEQGLSNQDVVAFAYSAIRDNRTCPICRSYDGIVRPKDDPIWERITPPNHGGDRCRKIPVTRFEAHSITAISRIPKVEPAPGFGGTKERRLPGPAMQGRINAIQKRIAEVETDADARRVLSDIDRLGGFTRERGNLQGRLERKLRQIGADWPDHRARAKTVADLSRRR